MRDLFSNVAVQSTLVPAVYTAAQSGAAVDSHGFNAICHVVHAGTSGDTLSGALKIEFRLQDSDDGTTWYPVTRALDVNQSKTAPYQAVDANGTFLVIDAPGEASAMYKVGYIGYRKYSRVVSVLTGTHTNGMRYSMSALKGHAASLPVAS